MECRRHPGTLPLRRAARRLRPDRRPQLRLGLGDRPARRPRNPAGHAHVFRSRRGRRRVECCGCIRARRRSGTTAATEERDDMALMDFLKRQFIDIIEWTDDSRDTLSYRFPDDDKEIKSGAQLIVRESQVVAVRLPRRVRRHVRSRQAHADDRQHPDPHQPQGVEVRLRVAVQGRRLLRHDAALHRQQVGHVEPGHDARRRLRHRPGARLRHLRLPRSSTRSCS